MFKKQLVFHHFIFICWKILLLLVAGGKVINSSMLTTESAKFFSGPLHENLSWLHFPPVLLQFFILHRML